MLRYSCTGNLSRPRNIVHADVRKKQAILLHIRQPLRIIPHIFLLCCVLIFHFDHGGSFGFSNARHTTGNPKRTTLVVPLGKMSYC